jgi:[glutamine synthetase] adenylyltransferase / [glutamine synthetase]-adenylyl-L-tyrosine phosphorylase
MTGRPLAQTFRGRISASPLLPKGVKPQALIRDKLTSLLDDDNAAACIADVHAAEPNTAALIAGVIHHAPFLHRIMRRHPNWLIGTCDDDPDAQFRSILGSVRTEMVPCATLEEAMARLREIRLRMALHIALCDLGGLWSVDRVVAALSDFADAAVDVALRLALREAERAGRLQALGFFDSPAQSGITVLAMGKHGAHELNYSSDIDLIVLFDPDRLPVSGHREPLDVTVRIIKDLVRVLHEQTGTGYVFRTDLRLRPDPASTPIAVPINRALQYYQTVGQNWERAALIKARPVAGDLALGEAFLAELTPFIWRRYFDYASIADIHAMKRQIHAHKGGEVIAIEGHDIKLGRGGIREVEFFVQTQQLVFGGRQPGLRGRQTLDMLKGLSDAGWIALDAVTDLSDAYRFLRMVEHRLQMVEDQQTQKLPKRKEDVDSLALFCGNMPTVFRKKLLTHFSAVERHYAKLFEGAADLSNDFGSLIFVGSDNDPATLATLRKMGFQRPEVVSEIVRGWHFGRRSAITTQRSREVLTELTPALLESFARSSDPDGALVALDNALQSMPAVVELFTILKQNAALRGLFAEVLGNAPRLAEVVVQRPHVLDALIDPAFAEPIADDVLRRRFHDRLDGLPAFEEFLDVIRDLARGERFQVGARLLSGVMDPLEAGPAHAGIAAAAIDACVTRVSAELQRRYGSVPGVSFAVVALGKLGGREMTALSDLDLMIIYDVPDADTVSDGERPIQASEWFARMTQRMMTALTVPTQRGTLYEVDLRLRPSGGKGPVAVSLSAFAQYHASESETWERMALTRARVISATPGFSERVQEAIVDALKRLVETPKLLKDIREMRALMAREKPARSNWDLKLTAGGLVDIEFANQCLTLLHAADLQRLPRPNTGASLTALASAGLLARPLATALQEAWQLQSSLAQLMAITVDGPFDPMAARLPFKRRLAAVAELPDFASLEGHLKTLQAEAHRAMTAVLSGQAAA